VIYSVEQHVALCRVSDLTPSPCGTWLAVVVQHVDREGAKYVSDLWKVPTDGSAALQLTRGESNDVSPCFRKDGALGFLSNRQPNEIKPDEDADKRMQVWILPAGGGEPQQLTDEPLGVLGFQFAKSAERLLVLAPVIDGVPHEEQRELAQKRSKNGPSARRFTEQPVRHWDEWLHENPDRANTHLVAYDASGKSRIDLTPKAKREFAISPEFDISADGKWAVVTRQTIGRDRELDTTLLVIELESGVGRVFGAAENVNLEGPSFSPDGKTIAAIRSIRSTIAVGRPLATLFDVETGSMRQIGANWDRWPGTELWSADGSKLYFATDDEGVTPVFSMDVASGEVERLTSKKAGGAHSNLRLLPDGRIACIRSTLLDAPECFIVASTPDSLPHPLARLSGFGGASDWAEVESLEVTSTDGVPIQTFLVKPKGAALGTALRNPLLLWIHGGPIGMDQDGWHWRWNPLLMVAQGYAVALPNPRGSTGFGQEFIQGIWGNVWGDQCYKDLMAVTDALTARADIDASRTMAMGGSFGGYMTNWIGTQTDRFRCLVTHASIATMAQFTGTTDHPAWWYLEMGGENPYADLERFDRFAPIRHIQNWKTPVLIIHGEKDYRCPINEGLNLFEALQYHGVKSELVVFPDENHWILKPRNVVAWYEAVSEFIQRHFS
jgi:dipeptidyl aminopeptidase/acylaminoacyl peptidase